MSIGRNDPCPCLSGKKYKKCCANRTSSTTDSFSNIDFTKIRKKNINWPTYHYELTQMTSPHEFEWTNEGIYYSGKKPVVYVPTVLNGIQVTAIAPEGFAGSSVREIYLPPTLEEIGNQAFDGCRSLTNIQFPPNLKRIGRWAFQGCESLTAIYLNDGLEEIDGYAFDECLQLRAVRLPQRMRLIGAYAFSNTALEQVVLPAGVEYLGNSAFYGCQRLERVFFQEGLEQIGTMTFMGCIRLQAVHFPNSLKVIRANAFQGCSSLQEVLVQDNIKAIDEHAFVGCIGIRELIVPFRSDVQVELFDLTNDLPFLAGMRSESRGKRHGFLGSIILTEAISRKQNVNWRFLEQPQTYTDALLVEANLQYGLNFTKIESKQLLGPEATLNLDEAQSDMEEFEIGNLATVENVEPEQTQITDYYVKLLSQGVSCKHNGDLAGAQASYIKAINLKPKEYTAYYNLGKILYIQQDFEASVRSYQTALELGCNTSETFLHLGHALLDITHKEGRYKSAIQQYEEALNPLVLTQRLKTGEKMVAPTSKQVEEYDALCLQAAESYISSTRGNSDAH